MKKQNKNVFPTLYKKNTQGKIEQWKIEVKRHSDFDIKDEFHVVTTYGEYEGKQQTKWYKVKIGKNIGRSNATEAVEQAFKEAEAKFKKKLKSGYVLTLKDAQCGKTDKIIKGGINPMLAHPYEDHKDKIKFPVLAQPKLDGQRCIAHFKNDKVTLWTRTRKEITSCPHIVKKLEQIFKGQDELYLDGELYNHELRNDFEKLMSAVRKNEPSEASASVLYFVYDCILPEGGCTVTRQLVLERFITSISHFPITLTASKTILNEKALNDYHERCVRNGFEGVMVRNRSGEYEHKRSKNLLKLKTFQDDEFKITDLVPGKDNTVVAVCETKNKTKFEATMVGDKIANQEFIKNKKKYIGKKLTVKYQGLTGKNKVPRFPVGLRIRVGKE